MTRPRQLAAPEAPAVDRPRATPYRYWGDAKPPKNRADVFSTTVAPRAADTDTPGADDEAAPGGNVATIRIYGPIDSWGGFWGVSAADVTSALDGLGDDVTDVVVRVNSPGGEAWEGFAIVNALRAWEAASDARTVTTVVDGIAASAGSLIAVASGSRAVMSPGTQLMVHDAWSYAMGNAAELAKVIAMLDSVSDSCAALYAEKAGGTDEAWRDVMRAEKWYTAKEAQAAALVDDVAVVPDAGPTSTAGDQLAAIDSDVEDRVAAEVAARFDLSIYTYAGRAAAPAHQPPAASAPGSPTAPKEALAVVDITPEQLSTMARSLGLPETADVATVVAALPEALAERAEDTPQTAAPGAVPPGMTLIDETALDALRAQAASGQAARDQQLADHRERVLAAAMAAGKFAPSRLDHFRSAWDADPEGTEELVVNKLAEGVVPVDERGHDQATPGKSTSSAYDALYGKGE